MPLWKGIGTHFAKQMKDYPTDTSPLEAISAFCHEYSKPNAIDQIRDLLHIDKAEPGPAHLSFAALPFDVVLTTNFDLLLEKAYDIKKIPFYPVLHDDQLSTSSIVNLSVSNNDTYSSNRITRILIKIHGDVNHPHQMVLTEEDYDLFSENHPLISTYIANLLITRTPLFIGYSIEDYDFRAIWQIIGSRLGGLRRRAYTLFNSKTAADIARFGYRGVKVIPLDIT